MKKITGKKIAVSEDRSGVNALLKNIRANPLRKSEKGAAYVALAEVYLDTANGVLEQYRKSLEDTVNQWHKLDRLGKDFEEKLSVAKVRSSLANGK